MQKMINFDVTKESIKEHNLNWPEIPDHPYWMLIIGGSESEKTNSLFNLINHQPTKIKFIYKLKIDMKKNISFWLTKEKVLASSIFINPKAFLEYSSDMDDIYKSNEEYNPNKKHKILTVFDMIADMLSNKKPNPIITELLIKRRKLNISLVFILQSYFTASKNVRLNSTYYFVIKISNKQEVQ